MLTDVPKLKLKIIYNMLTERLISLIEARYIKAYIKDSDSAVISEISNTIRLSSKPKCFQAIKKNKVVSNITLLKEISA